MKEAVSAKEQALKDDTRLRKRVADLESELERKKRLALQAIAARSNIKIELTESIKKNAVLLKEIEVLNETIVECKTERNRYSQKHDEMFSSVSNLNARIEELESHKMHLLNKLKKYGDKGGLEYII
jgi:chromosome segregation ATPase